ncbi:MAG: hypothetical protein HY342_02435 [Candidatus Lambdaproteobacteria bacterium]|nr:hypothetical protein [Candidatus Lambdaproteobacteria bacterium]
MSLLAALCALTSSAAQGRELRRSMPFIRPSLMGDAYVAVADEASAILYNPAALAGLPNKSVSAFVPQLTIDDQLLDAILDPQSLQDKYSGLDENSLRDLTGTTVNSNFNIAMPFVALPNSGMAFGFGLDLGTSLEVLDNPIGPNLDLEFYFDRVLLFTMAARVNEQLDIGITPKLVNRSGIHKILRFGELFASSATLSFDNDPTFKDLSNGVSFTTVGLDVGLVWRLPAWPEWHPRIAFSALNLGGVDEGRGFRGMEFGQRPIAEDPPEAGELPQINTLGFAVSPIHNGIRYTVALDIVDVTRTLLPGDDLLLRSRLGLEIGIGVRKDGTALFSLLGGYNAGHSSLGILSRVWIFEVGLGSYTVERGEKSGDNPDNRNVLVFGFRI